MIPAIGTGGGMHPPPVGSSAELQELWGELVKAQDASIRACDRRGALPPGTSRARVTTANANWARAAEARDRAAERYEAARIRALEVP